MSVAEASRFPIIIAEWERNSRELVRVSLDRFNNRNTIFALGGATQMAPSNLAGVG